MNNKVELIGNVVNDLKYYDIKNNEQMVCFTLATNESYKNKEGEKVETSDFHSIIVFNKYFVKLSQNIQKGDRLYLIGKLKYTKYIDKNGNDAYRTNVVVDNAGAFYVIKRFSQEG